MLGSPGAFQAPASRDSPSAQARKGRGPGHNRRKHYAIFKELPPFRNWALGQERAAGAWQGDTLKSHAHEYVGHQTQYGGASGSYSAVLQYTQTRTTGMFGESETRPVNIAQPVIIYLGRPR